MSKSSIALRLAYPAAAVVLIIAFSLSMIRAISTNQDWSLCVGILILLLALVVYRNRTLKLTGNKKTIAALGLCGVALTIVSVSAAFVYGILGLLLLMGTQLRIVLGGKSIWILTGGNPLHKLDKDESKVTGMGLAMLLSVALTFFIKVLWLVYSNSK